MRGFFAKFLIAFIYICILASPAKSQTCRNPILTGWERYLSNSLANPTVDKADKLLDWCDSALLNFFNGKEKSDESIFVTLLEKTERLSAKDYPGQYNRCLLLKSRYYFIQNKDSSGSDIHNQAMTYFAHASNAEVAPAMFLLSNAWRYHTNRAETKVSDTNFYQIALTYYNSVGNTLRSLSIQRAIAHLYILANHPEKALADLQRIYALQIKMNDSSRHKTQDLLAHCNAVAGNYKGALDNAFASLNYLKTIKDSLDLGVCYMRLGRILRDISDTSRSIIYFNLALEEFNKEKDEYEKLFISIE